MNIKFKFCNWCKTKKNRSEFYRDGSGANVYCKECTSVQSVKRQRLFKMKAIELCGGECRICEYRKCPGALEFHHKNPGEKDFSISSMKITGLSEKNIQKLKTELDKCVLLCANCHREEHERIRDGEPTTFV